MSAPRLPAARARRRRDRRPLALVLALAGLVAIGLLIPYLPGRGVIAELPSPATPPAAEPVQSVVPAEPPADPHQAPRAHARQARAAEVKARFDQAVAMLHARRYDHAMTALHRVLELEPTLVEAHVNMGFALIGAERPAAARDFFATAVELRPQQANAYYGLAMSYEALGEIEPALGAMRTYLHLTPADDPYRRKANAALWEWQSARRESGGDDPPAAPAPAAAPAEEG